MSSVNTPLFAPYDARSALLLESYYKPLLQLIPPNQPTQGWPLLEDAVKPGFVRSSTDPCGRARR
eukprot:5138087-Karenia_brevis.AAC.1